MNEETVIWFYFSDTRNSVLEYAKKLGIDRLYLVDPNSSIENTSISIFDYMEGDKPRVVFDCSGSSLTNQIAINVKSFVLSFHNNVLTE